ncbi:MULTISPECIES: hypothetical protein [unclassified Cyanobium]|nr:MULTISPECIES: hypothetical protein [unclassified Cyanobium]
MASISATEARLQLNIQRRLVYQVLPDERVVKVLRLWTHYE